MCRTSALSAPNSEVLKAVEGQGQSPEAPCSRNLATEAVSKTSGNFKLLIYANSRISGGICVIMYIDYGFCSNCIVTQTHTRHTAVKLRLRAQIV